MSEILPRERQLDCIAHEDYDVLRECLNERLDDQGAFSDLERRLTMPNLVAYTDALAEALRYGREFNQDAKNAAYEAFCFAELVAQALQPGEVRIMIPTHYGQLLAPEGFDPENTQRQLTDEAQAYLQHRPKIDSLIGEFSIAIDPSGRYGDVVETVAALTFSHIEHGAREAYIDEQVEQFSTEIDMLSME